MTNKVEKLIGSIEVLIVGHNAYVRKVIRSLPVDLGVKNVHGSGNGIAGLEAIGAHPPDIVVVDWEMPLLNAADLLRARRCWIASSRFSRRRWRGRAIITAKGRVAHSRRR